MAEQQAVSGESVLPRRERRELARRLRRDLKRQGVLASGAALTVGAVLAGISPANAATFTVLNTGDAGAGTLRQAFLDANGAAGADDIVFDPSVFGTPQTISLLTGQLQTTGPLIVTGPGASLLTVRRDPAAATNLRVFDITAAALPAVTISGLTVSGGVSAADGGGINAVGAVGQSVNVVDCVVTGNNATGANDGGGISIGANTALTLQRTVVSGNIAGDGGGGIYL